MELTQCDSFDYRTFTEKQRTSAKPQKKEHKNGLVLVVRRHIGEKGRLSKTDVAITSPALATVLEELNPEVESLEQLEPPVADPVLFYHSRGGLNDRLQTEKSKDDRNDALIDALETALEYIQTDEGETAANMDKLLSRGEITWDLLWALFIPGRLVYHYHELTQQKQLVRFRKMTQKMDYGESRSMYWSLDCDMVVFDGEKFGLAKIKFFRIHQYPGAQRIVDLVAYPLEFVENKDEVFNHAVARGMRYSGIRKATYVDCDGPAMKEILNEDLKEKQFTFPAFGRAMIDAKSFRTFEPNATYNYNVYKQLAPDLDSELYAICSPVVMGFSFGTKQWGGLGMDYCHEVAWGNECFRDLVLDQDKKTLVQALVTQHSSKTFDDIVAGKGKGLIGLLCGRPGCGKTLTVEAISEETRKPLYAVSAGELGTNPADVDKRLTEVLELARRWGAVLLLDEADVFLQRRSDADIVRNSLVSIFLRQLEYYKGILVLTTNRIGAFDDAFESRIHFSLYYPDLNADSRKQLWSSFLKRLKREAQLEVRIDAAEIDELAQHDLNGRQIKNIISNALSIALHEGSSNVRIGHISTSLKVLWDWRKAVEQEAPASSASIPETKTAGLAS
ncbi:P-loop containing nucleoside triphosphate hydrolase protein [Phyllosticta citribraziliensis]|uniref:P-loop containing nucleoside triphosphate hydrolase protein n=1 Tax=Phyllosticta citribraziliensis TaxID=989973 RepID=A0ABR1LDR2_9PEZI